MEKLINLSWRQLVAHVAFTLFSLCPKVPLGQLNTLVAEFHARRPLVRGRKSDELFATETDPVSFIREDIGKLLFEHLTTLPTAQALTSPLVPESGLTLDIEVWMQATVQHIYRDEKAREKELTVDEIRRQLAEGEIHDAAQYVWGSLKGVSKWLQDINTALTRGNPSGWGVDEQIIRSAGLLVAGLILVLEQIENRRPIATDEQVEEGAHMELNRMVVNKHNSEVAQRALQNGTTMVAEIGGGEPNPAA
jgi:hypothetical protein